MGEADLINRSLQESRTLQFSACGTSFRQGKVP